MKRAWVVELVERLPQALVSRGWGWLARRRHPKVGVSLLKHVFVRATGIDLAEAGTKVGDYETLEDLFVRRLRPGARRIDPDPTVIVSPVDGTVGACGQVTSGTLVQVKGRTYALSRLLGDEAKARDFEGGAYATLYLAPHNYHRIHAPVAGNVPEAVHIPGGLMPVFDAAVESVEELFARNERWITYLEHPSGARAAVVKVGATLVGRISVAYDPGVHTNDGTTALRRRTYEPPKTLGKGAELGAFELGSTVVLILAKEAGHLELEPGTTVKMGERIGTLAEVDRRVRRPVPRPRKKRSSEQREA